VGQYPTMDLESICKMDVASLAAEDAVLFLWATAPCFPDALQAAYSWGFSYKTNLVWNKVRGFNGHYSDVQHEHLLIATRGSCLPSGPLHKSIFTEEKQRHSKKPELVYTIIESMYPAVPRVELFSRSKREGWKTWGDDAPSDGVKPVMGQLSSRGDGVASARRSGLTA